jgi:hypothetical protein
MPFVRVEVGLRHVQRASAGKDIKDKCERTITRVRDLTHEERGKLLEIAELCPLSRWSGKARRSYRRSTRTRLQRWSRLPAALRFVLSADLVRCRDRAVAKARESKVRLQTKAQRVRAPQH